jgi:phenylacetic acid degradation protein
MVVPARSLALGTPARVIRTLRDDEIAWKRQGTMQYHELTLRSMRTMHAVAPLAQAEEQRARIQVSAFAEPKIRHRKDGA